MPIYEYRCTSCGRTLEVLQRLDDPPPAQCPDCGSPLEKLFSAPSFQFKGSGWYATDYAGKKAGSEDRGESAPAETKSGSSADGKSDGESATGDAAST